MNFGSHSSIGDRSPSLGRVSGWRRRFSNEGLERMESTRFNGVDEVLCHRLKYSICKKVVKTVSIEGKCGPEVEKCETRRRTRSNGGTVKVVWTNCCSDERKMTLIPSQNRLEALRSP